MVADGLLVLSVLFIVVAPIVRVVYLRVHAWRFGHRLQYRETGLIENVLLSGVDEVAYDAYLLAGVCLSGALLSFTVWISLNLFS